MIPGVRTLAHAELGTRPSAVMRRPWRRAHRVEAPPPPRGTPAVIADARLPRVTRRLGLLGWLVLLVTQSAAAASSGIAYLVLTAEPHAHDEPLALVPLNPEQTRRTRPRRRRPVPSRTTIDRPTMDAVLNAVREQSGPAQTCMQTAIHRGDLVRNTPYRFNLNWEITPDGEVRAPRVVIPPGVPAATLAPCLRSAMGAWRFPKSQLGVTVRRFPFHFTVR